MRQGKTIHNFHVSHKEYLELKKKYPTGTYTKTETHSWFTLTIKNIDVLSDNNYSLEIVFWREEK